MRKPYVKCTGLKQTINVSENPIFDVFEKDVSIEEIDDLMDDPEMDPEKDHPKKVVPGREMEALALLKRAERRHRNGNYLEALRYYRRSVRFDPSNSQTWLNLGLVYSQLGRVEDAVKAYYLAGIKNPDLYKVDRERASRNEKKVEQTLEHGGTPHRYRITLKEFEEVLGIKDKAQPIEIGESAQRDVEFGEVTIPDDGDIEELKEPAEIEDSIALELGKIKDLSEPWNEHFDQVIGYYKNMFRIIEKRPPHVYHYEEQEHEDWIDTVRQDIRKDMELYEEQLPHFEKDTKKNILCNIALNLCQILDFENSIEVCERSLEIDPDYKETLMINAHCHSYIGRYREAIGHYENALEKEDSLELKCEILELKGAIHFRLGELKEAEECYITSLKISGNLISSGKVLEGRRGYDRSLERVENLAFMSEILYLKGRAHLHMKEYAKGRRYLLRAREIAHNGALINIIEMNLRSLEQE